MSSNALLSELLRQNVLGGGRKQDQTACLVTNDGNGANAVCAYPSGGAVTAGHRYSRLPLMAGWLKHWQQVL